MADSDYIGRMAPITKVHTFTISGITGTFAIGDVLSDQLHELVCPALGKGGFYRVLQVNAFEHSPEGTQIKASLRVHFNRLSYTPPAQDDPYKGPTSYIERKGHVDIDTSDYLEVGDGSGTDPDYAQAVKPLATPIICQANDVANVAWALVEIREAKSYTGAELTLEIITEKI